MSLLPLAVVGSPEMGRAGVILVQALIDVGGRGAVILVISVSWDLECLFFSVDPRGAVLTSD